jgi:hypothetical protein
MTKKITYTRSGYGMITAPQTGEETFKSAVFEYATSDALEGSVAKAGHGWDFAGWYKLGKNGLKQLVTKAQTLKPEQAENGATYQALFRKQQAA